LSLSVLMCFLLSRRHQVLKFFPYTTLFRSAVDVVDRARVLLDVRVVAEVLDRLRVAGDRIAALEVRLVSDPLLHAGDPAPQRLRSEEHTSELQSPYDLVCRPLLEKKTHAPC